MNSLLICYKILQILVWDIKIEYIKIEFTVVCGIRPVKCQTYTSQVSKKGLQKLKKLLHLEMPVVSTFEKFNKKKSPFKNLDFANSS